MLIVEQKIMEVLEIYHQVYSIKLGRVAFEGNPDERPTNYTNFHEGFFIHGIAITQISQIVFSALRKLSHQTMAHQVTKFISFFLPLPSYPLNFSPSHF